MRALKERARLAMLADELPEALAALRALQAIEPSVATTCNLGLVARRVGALAEAAENLNRCLATYNAVPVDRRDEAERGRVEEIAGELAMARAAVAVAKIKAPEGAVIAIDGQPAGVVDPDREYFLEPGWHTFTATSDGASFSQRTELARGKTHPVSLEPPPIQVEASRRDAWPIVGWVGTGGLAATGIVFLIASELDRSAEKDHLQTALNSPGGCAVPIRNAEVCAAFAEARDTSIRFHTASVAAFTAAGAMALGTTIYMTYRAASSKASAPRAVVGITSIKVEVPW